MLYCCGVAFARAGERSVIAGDGASTVFAPPTGTACVGVVGIGTDFASLAADRTYAASSQISVVESLPPHVGMPFGRP